MDQNRPQDVYITDLDELLPTSKQSHPYEKKESAVYRSQNALPKNFDQMKSMPDLAKSDSPIFQSKKSISLIADDANTMTPEKIDPEVYTQIISDEYKPAIYPIKPLSKSDRKALFEKYDYDKSGTIHYTELFPLLQEIMSDKHHVALKPKDVIYVLNLFDPMGAGRVTYDDFKVMIKILKGSEVHTHESIAKLREKKMSKLKKTSRQFGVELGF